VGNQEKEQKERVIQKENTGRTPVLLWDDFYYLIISSPLSEN
jgi:hypothetical protein